MTPKQENFARLYVETGNASEAYRRAYDTGRMKPETINNNAHMALKNSEIAAMVAALKAEHAERHDVTVDSITAELDEASKVAMDTANPAAMVSATMGKAKLHGLITDRSKMEATLSSHEAWLDLIKASE